MQSRAGQVHHRGFSLLELLVVIGIIAILVSIIIPMVSKVRTAARTTASANMISQLSQAITTYQTDYRAYPGPLAYNEIYNKNVNASSWLLTPTNTTVAFATVSVNPPSGFDLTTKTAAQYASKITDSENLVLGLLGGLKIGGSGGDLGKLIYDPSLVGQGPMSLNQTATGKRNNAYLNSNQLSWNDVYGAGKIGHFRDESGEADDSIIPEFVDNYSVPMPILYMRARRGVPPVSESTGSPSAIQNSIISYDSSDSATLVPFRQGTYDLHQIIAYTGAYTGDWKSGLSLQPDPSVGGQTIGEGKVLKISYADGIGSNVTKPFHGLAMGPKPTANLGPANSSNMNYDYPYNAYPYFRNNSMSSAAVPKAVQNDGYVLISAGPDRVYGTADDLTNFGSVGQ